MGVVARRHGFGIIEAAGRDVDLIGMVTGLKRELGAAMGTEAAGSRAARLEARRIPLHDSKLGGPDAEPGDKWRAGRAPAAGAMTIRLMERAARHLVTNPAAKASALQHRSLLHGGISALVREAAVSASSRRPTTAPFAGTVVIVLFAGRPARRRASDHQRDFV